ncbi:MAG: glycosyl transferase [Acidobacteria bacterium]|nr:MAG: glycosyl transferase [Acidobacteriota bacterium]
MWHALLALALLGIVSSTVFLILALVAARRYRRHADNASRSANAVPESALPPVTLLKPVHGMEPRLRENLESFFRQNYPDFEIIFGARSADNAALTVAEELRTVYPNVRCKVVLSGPPAWPSAKVFSLDKMIAHSRNDYFVISDSDVEVGPDFLRNIIPPLLDPKNGLLTCVYRGVPARSFWSSLEALGMSVEMTSGVLVADMLEGMRFALGAVIATKREALERIGGIGTTADYYSDDFVLGNLVWAAGYHVVLSHYIVDHVLIPSSFLRTFGHQVRWMKSTRFSRPKGHLGSGLTFAVPFGLLGLISASVLGHPIGGLVLLGVSILNRIIQSVAIGWSVTRDPRGLNLCWLYPLRDLMGFVTWVASYSSRSFFWRGETYQFTRGGKIVPQQRAMEDVFVNQP